MRSCLLSPHPLGLANLLSLLVCLTLAAGADTLPAPSSDEAPKAQAATLHAYRQIALENQPTIAATRAALKAALDRVQALDCLRVPSCLARDLPIRRKQAPLGVTIAQAGIAQAEAETLHGVTAGYLAALYANQQLRLTNDPKEGIRHRLQDLQKTVNDFVAQKQRRDVTLREHRNLVKSFLETLDGRVLEAEQGKLRALAAMREAMGVAPDCVVAVPDGDLPCPSVEPPTLNELIALAVARRGEVIQAAVFAQVVCLEIDAQASTGKATMRTFASSSDIHAKPVPTGDLGGLNFRPSIVGPDMPAFLNGSRDARVQQARDYHERALANAVKARNLVALEVEDLYRRWLDKAQKAKHLETAYREALTFSERLMKLYTTNQEKGDYPNADQMINAGLMATRLQLEWREAHFQALLALAALERATSGGFAVDFDAAPACDSNNKKE
jgi:outer membrane protein TolC